MAVTVAFVATPHSQDRTYSLTISNYNLLKLLGVVGDHYPLKPRLAFENQHVFDSLVLFGNFYVKIGGSDLNGPLLDNMAIAVKAATKYQKAVNAFIVFMEQQQDFDDEDTLPPPAKKRRLE